MWLAKPPFQSSSVLAWGSGSSGWRVSQVSNCIDRDQARGYRGSSMHTAGDRNWSAELGVLVASPPTPPSLSDLPGPDGKGKTRGPGDLTPGGWRGQAGTRPAGLTQAPPAWWLLEPARDQPSKYFLFFRLPHFPPPSFPLVRNLQEEWRADYNCPPRNSPAMKGC